MNDVGLTLQILLKLHEWRQHEKWSRPQIEAYQAEALQQLRDYAYAHSRFYQQFHKGLFKSPLQELPVLTKTMMMEHFDELVTDPAIHLEAVRSYAANDTSNTHFLNHYWVNATSGSSGHPGFFLFNRAEWITIM